MKPSYCMGSMLLIAGLALTMGTVGRATAAVEQETDGHPAHSHDRHGLVPPDSSAAKTWATDAPLREGMRRIRAAVSVALPDYRQHGLTQADAAALAVEIESAVTYLFANCRLEPAADAALHGLLAQMLQGAAALRANPAADDGLPRVLTALESYPRMFVDAQWQAVP